MNAQLPLVHLVEPDTALLADLAYALAAAGTRCHVHSSLPDLYRHLGTEPADALLIDRMEIAGGCEESLASLVSRDPCLSVVVLSCQLSVAAAVNAMRRGVFHVIGKPAPIKDVVEAVLGAIQETRKKRERHQVQELARNRLATLSPREREVLELVVAGKPTKQIAATLGIRPKTVEIHRTNLVRKARVDSLAELVRLFLAATGETGRQTSAGPSESGGNWTDAQTGTDAGRETGSVTLGP